MSGQIFNAMVEFFEEDDWNFNWMDGLPVLSMAFSGKNGKWMCYAQAREEQEQFVFYSVCPVNVPPSRIEAATEFITRANYGMIIGNFELDYADGEIRYKTSIDVEGDSLTAPLVKQMVYANVLIMDRYLPGILSVVYGDADPAEEILEIEQQEHADFDLPKRMSFDGDLNGDEDEDLDDDDELPPDDYSGYLN